MGAFVGSQFGVFGPIPLGALIVGVALAVRRRSLASGDLLLLCFTLPPLLIVTAQAFISRANANWSGAGYLAGAVLVAAWLVRWRAKGWLIAALAMQGAVAAFFMVGVLSPSVADWQDRSRDSARSTARVPRAHPSEPWIKTVEAE